MTKIEIVTQALETNPNVKIVKMIECNYLPGRSGYWSHTLDFFVAPIKGIYSGDQLQSLMMGLIPDLNPDSVDSFRQSRESMEFGKLYFDEEIGTEQITRLCTLTDQVMFGSSGFVDGKKTIEQTEDYMRRTWVRLFPDIRVAEDILEGKLDSEYHISMDKLREYQPSFVQRLLNRR